MNECSNDPIKLYLQEQCAEKQKQNRQKAGWIRRAAENLPTPNLIHLGFTYFDV